MRPFRQGALDGLCGAYSIVNAIRAICPELTDDHSEYLFTALMTFVGERGRAPVDVVCYGLGKRLLRGGIRIGIDYTSQELAIGLRERQLKIAGKPTVARLWRLLAEVLGPNSVAIVGLGGRENHWTVAIEGTERQLRLLDSGNRRVLRRSACTLRHDPNQVVLAEREIIIIERLD